ncbi:ectomycorrhiza-upregulated zf-MYND domain-containing protein [Ophiocordyceps sinensis CO18]|uniref:Ectomycorrhiza-upregulated zf-MYND domain-containing protein n=1 Tax=Ophiocordyceps sinensis (strain Co18 / CGMCC 3.14243) TaxID=911162 RepID=T5AKF1_OPHSC|nr:ectomycorrhiza-upregulated zf-MYND domain-containing protein [Ophiocordyceps sinensis CO18]
MAPIDYSKWDNIDTDSEPEASIQQEAPAAKPIPPPTHASPQHSDSGHVEAVIVRCTAEIGAPWSATTIPANHDVFSQSVPSVPGLIEVPLVFHRAGTQSVNRAGLDNQIATYLNIDANSGFAPPEWQSNVGTVVVARKDRKPLCPQHLEGVWMFCDYILDLFGEGDGPPRRLYNRHAFERWWLRYCEEQKGFRFGKGGARDLDDWRAVPSPFEV